MLVRTQARSDAQAVAETRAEAEAQASAACPAPAESPAPAVPSAAGARAALLAAPSARALRAVASCTPAIRFFGSFFARRRRSFSSASERRVYTGSAKAGACRRASKGSAAPARHAARSASSSPRPVGAHSCFRKQRAARREQFRVLAQRVACDQQRPVPCGAQLFGSRHGPHDAVGFQTVDARIGHGEPHGIHLFAHGVGHHQHRAAHARMPRAPRHRVERRHAHQGHAERRRHALGRGQRNAHTGERSRAAPAHDARDLALLDALRSQGRVDARQQLRVGCAARLHLQGQHYIHRGGVFARHDLRQQSSQAQGDHLVGRVEREHVRRRAGMPAFRGLKGRWDVVLS